MRIINDSRPPSIEPFYPFVKFLLAHLHSKLSFFRKLCRFSRSLATQIDILVWFIVKHATASSLLKWQRRPTGCKWENVCIVRIWHLPHCCQHQCYSKLKLSLISLHFGSRTMVLGVDSAYNRKEYQESSWGKGRPAHKADNLTAICEPTV
jgi:hypothetical protein